MEDQESYITTHKEPTGISDIIPAAYMSRPFLTGAITGRHNPRTIDQYPDHIPGTYTPATPDTTPPPVCTFEMMAEALRIAFRKTAKQQGWTSVYIHPDNKDTIYDMLRLITGDPDTTLNRRKGIYLTGNHGSGKTEIMQHIITCMTAASHRYKNIRRPQIHMYDHLYDAIRNTGNTDSLYKNVIRNVYIDDFLYQQRSVAKVYGNTDSVPDLIITRCYELYKYGYRLYMTSNYGPKYMHDNGYIHSGSYDRLREMCNIVEWKGESLR